MPKKMGEDIFDLVLEAFFPNELLSEASLHGSGHIHQTYKVETILGTYLLQKFNRKVFPNFQRVADNIEALSEYLCEHESETGLKPLLPIATEEGNWFFESPDGDLWRAFEFIKGGISIEKAKTKKNAFQAGKAYGIFATALKDFPVENLQETIPGFHDSVARWQSFEKILAADPVKRAKSCMEFIDFMQLHYPLFYEIKELQLPVRAVHNDAKIGNVLFSKSGGGILAVTDWDTVMPGFILADFGDLVRSIVSPVAEDERDVSKVVVRLPFFKALCEGYLLETANWLQPVERTHLLHGARWIVLEQGMRFLHDFLEGDIYYPTSYPLHNLDRAINQIALYQAIMENKEEMEEIIRKI